MWDKDHRHNADHRACARLSRDCQVVDEEPDRAADFEGRDFPMRARVGVQGLLGRAECIEQLHGGVPRLPFIVPLQHELDPGS